MSRPDGAAGERATCSREALALHTRTTACIWRDDPKIEKRDTIQMPRRTSRISQDEVRRLIKATLACGLEIRKIAFDGQSIVIETGDRSSAESNGKYDPDDPETFETLDQYRDWRDRQRSRENG